MSKKFKQIIFLFSLILVLILSVTASFAATDLSQQADEYYNRICARVRSGGLTAFVCDLRDRLDKISNIQGSQNPVLMVADANGQKVGILTDSLTPTQFGAVKFWDINLNIFSSVSYFSDRMLMIYNLTADSYYAEEDCQGPHYKNYMDTSIDNRFYPYYVHQVPSFEKSKHGWQYVRILDFEAIKQNLAIKSWWNSAEQRCESYEAVFERAAEMSPTSRPTYVWPLRIVEQW